MKKLDGGVTAPQGFSAAGAAAGIKKDGKDMALIYSESPCQAAGTFTTNLVKAAPVKWDQEVVSKGKAVHAVVVNSGVANACTGVEGLACCRETARKAGEVLRVSQDEVLVASTGVIGAQIPLDKIKAGIEKLALALEESRKAGEVAAEAIMTTDTRKKEAAVSFEIGGKTVTLGGMCKGSG